MPRIYVDFDDVLCETARGLAELLQAEWGKRVAYEEIRWFDLGRSFGLTERETARLLDAGHRPEILGSFRPTPGAQETLWQWRARGCEICIVTGRPPATAGASRAWLDAHAMPYDRLFFVDKYRRLPPGPDLLTLDALAGMEFAFAVDDAPAMLEFLVVSMPMPVLIYDRPWNSGFAPPTNGRLVARCRSWEEIGRHTREILRQEGICTGACLT